MGRHSTYTPEIDEEIINRISNGEPLRVICRDEHMPAWRTVYDWLDSDQEFSARFARARDLGFDAIAQQALEIADTPMLGFRTEIGDDGKTKTVEEDMLGHRKLQIETRLKLLAKWSPKRYGDKIDLNHGGVLSIRDVSELSDAELTAIATAGS